MSDGIYVPDSRHHKEMPVIEKCLEKLELEKWVSAAIAAILNCH